MQSTDVPCHAPGIVSRQMDGEAVLVDPVRGKVRVLNGVGARIWELTDGRRDVIALARALAEEYDVSQERAEGDVLAFCEDLVRRGVVLVARFPAEGLDNSGIG